jgi:hypothetical protein
MYVYFGRHNTAAIDRTGGIYVYMRSTGTTNSLCELLQELLRSDEVDPQDQNCSSQRLLRIAKT